MSAAAIISQVRRLQSLQKACLPKTTKKTTAIAVRRPTTDLDAWATDFPSFAALLDIIPKSGERQKLRPNAIQAAFETKRCGRDIILKPRQVGFTTWELARDIWFFLTRRGARVVIVTQSMADDSAINELAEKLRIMFRSLADAGIDIPGLDAATTKWVLPARDASLKIIGAGASEKSAKKKGRSGTIHRLHVTELAFFEHADETMNALLACVPGPEFGAEIILESTANGAAGLFFERYQAAKKGRGGFTPHFFSWLEQAEYQTPLDAGETIEPQTDRERELVDKHHARPEQVKWYRKKVEDVGQDLVDQEFPTDEETCWIASGRLFFDAERTRQLLGLSVEPLEKRAVGGPAANGWLRLWARPKPGVEYVISADPSEGVGGDPGAGAIFERATGVHVGSIHGQFSTWEMAGVLADAGREFNEALLVVERNNHGHAVLQALEHHHHYPSIYRAPKDSRPGWNTGAIARATSLERLHNAHRTGEWSSPDRVTLAEMLRFIVRSDGRPEAAAGAHDDCVMAHAIGWDVLSTPYDDGELLTFKRYTR